MSRSVLLVSAFYFLSLLQQREAHEEEEASGDLLKERPHCPIPHTIFVKMDPSVPGAVGGKSGRKSGTINYSREEVTSLMRLIVDVIPVCAEGWEYITAKHAESWPVGRTTTSIKTKYAAVKRIKSSTGNPNIPEYVQLAREAHKLIGEKANLGTAEEVFDLEQGFIKSEAVAGLTALASGATIAPTAAATAGGSIAGGGSIAAPIILAGDESSSEEQQQRQEREEYAPAAVASAAVASSASASNLTPSLVESTPAKKRSYQGQRKTVPDAAVFNEYIINQQQRQERRDLLNNEYIIQQRQREERRDQREERRDQRSIEMWSGVKDVAEKFLGAAMTMMNTWQQQQQHSYHGPYRGPPPPPPGNTDPPPYHSYDRSFGCPPSVASTFGGPPSVASTSSNNKRKRTGDKEESHGGEKKHHGPR